LPVRAELDDGIDGTLDLVVGTTTRS